MKTGQHVLFLMGLIVLCAGMPLDGQEESAPIRRLILADGSDEAIREHTVAGGRVRYFSAERHAWEELPEEMIDWKATRDAASQARDEASERGNRAAEQAATERAAYDARRPEVAPGMRVPASGGVFMMDVYRGNPELLPLRQNGADRNRNMKSNILRGLVNPVSGSNHTVELDGARAPTQAHTGTPEIFLSVDPDDKITGYDSRTAREHLRLVRCERGKGRRTVVAYNIAVYGKVSRKAEEVAIKVEPLSEHWVRIVPAEPLPPGEYALVEWDAGGAVNEFVWDFGVDPAAPPNAAASQGERARSGGAPTLTRKDQEE